MEEVRKNFEEPKHWDWWMKEGFHLEGMVNC